MQIILKELRHFYRGNQVGDISFSFEEFCVSRLKAFIPGSIVKVKISREAEHSGHGLRRREQKKFDLKRDHMHNSQHASMANQAAFSAGSTPEFGDAKDAHSIPLHQRERALRLLGLDPGQTYLPLEIHQAYKSSLQTHLRDSRNRNGEGLTKRVEQINKAFEQLSGDSALPLPLTAEGLSQTGERSLAYL